jgi:hypothetical protein
MSLYPTQVKVPATITMDAAYLYVDGVAISFAVIPQILYELTHPDNRKWYRFERVGDTVTVYVKISEEKPDGNPIASTDPAGVGSQGTG